LTTIAREQETDVLPSAFDRRDFQDLARQLAARRGGCGRRRVLFD